MKDKLYKWLFKRSIRKYSATSIKNMYFNTLTAIKSGKYNGYLLHKLYLQAEVLRGKIYG